MPGSRLEEIYSELPVWLQNGIFSLYGLKLARMRYSPPFFALLRSLKESEWWSVERIREHQNERIRSVVRHAYRTVPFYRRWYDEHAVDIDAVTTTDDLARLPILSKQMVREQACEMVSSAFAKRNLTKELTSGTTGTPLTIYQTREGAAFQWAIWWRHKARFGLNFGDRHLVFGAQVPVSQRQIGSPYWRHDLFNKRVYLSTYHIFARQRRRHRRLSEQHPLRFLHRLSVGHVRPCRAGGGSGPAPHQLAEVHRARSGRADAGVRGLDPSGVRRAGDRAVSPTGKRAVISEVASAGDAPP